MGDFNGIIPIYKEKGFTSFDVVAKLRGILHMKKIGHTGTLDPEAEGVLPVALGKGTKLVDMLTDKDKTYEAVLHLGITTDTQDMTGSVLSEKEVNVTEEEACAAVKSFVGEQMQIPPMYSALKVGGRKLYELAREGQVVERKPRPVCFHEIEILEVNFPLIRFSVTCSKGTYIRTLCHDIGEKLGCGGCMEKLVRTRVERFELTDARKLCQIQEYVSRQELAPIVVPVDRMFDQYPAVFTAAEGDRLVHNGNLFPENLIAGELSDTDRKGNYRVYDSTKNFVGIFRRQGKIFQPVKMFYTAQ